MAKARKAAKKAKKASKNKPVKKTAAAPAKNKTAVKKPAPKARKAPAKTKAASRPASKPAAKSTARAKPIGKADVLAAFASIVRLDLDKALDDAIGIFGDDGARVKASVRKSKRNAVWNPVTLALGLHDVYGVPLGPLKRAFASHDFLHAWQDDWNQSLYLLGK